MDRSTILSFCLVVLTKVVFGEEYYGKLLGPLGEYDHGVSGDVYLVDNTRIRIPNFNYDGIGPAGVLYLAFSDTGAGDIPSNGGIIIPDPEGEMSSIRRYQNEDIVLSMPTGKTVQDLKWFSVWCEEFSVDFGSIVFNTPTLQQRLSNPPQQINVGEFTRKQHGVRSGDVILLNSRQILINQLHYDGFGPAAWFLMGGHPTNFHYQDAITTPIIPDEDGSVGVLKRYTGQTIEITLPDGYDIRKNDLRWLNIYCIDFSSNFGEVQIPENVNVIPYLPDDVTTVTVTTDLDNCEMMNEDFAVGWTINGQNIQMEFIGKLDDDEYMAFGLSGSNSGTSMINADVIVAHYTNDAARADDYFLNSYSQCSGGIGACRDSSITGGVDDISSITGERIDGVTRVKFTRSLNTGDTVTDKSFSISSSQYIAWAIGKLNPDGIATKHSVRIGTTANTQINFGRSAQKNCNPIRGGTVQKPPTVAWQIPGISGEDIQTFEVRIGPSGGDQGYTAITGNNAWGICIYINGLMIPELKLRRNDTYIFKIQSGDDINNRANYHPFYITNHAQGGHRQRTAEERANIKVYAGLDADGNPLDNSVGALCEYVYNGNGFPDDYSTFESFKEDLTQNPAVCEEFGLLVWTVPADAESLLYYHCWEHNWLGWKIHVVDEFTDNSNIVLPSIFVMLACFCMHLLR